MVPAVRDAALNAGGLPHHSLNMLRFRQKPMMQFRADARFEGIAWS
jgi:hypothetical protein